MPEEEALENGKSYKETFTTIVRFAAPPHRVRLPAALPGLRRDTWRGTMFCKNSLARWRPQSAVLTQWTQEEQVKDVHFARILCRRLLKFGVLLAGWKRAPLSNPIAPTLTLSRSADRMAALTVPGCIVIVSTP